jgi:hypothetical protein
MGFADDRRLEWWHLQSVFRSGSRRRPFWGLLQRNMLGCAAQTATSAGTTYQNALECTLLARFGSEKNRLLTMKQYLLLMNNLTLDGRKLQIEITREV